MPQIRYDDPDIISFPMPAERRPTLSFTGSVSGATILNLSEESARLKTEAHTQNMLNLFTNAMEMQMRLPQMMAQTTQNWFAMMAANMQVVASALTPPSLNN